MNIRSLFCIGLCFLVQHVSAMNRDDVDRCKVELQKLYREITDQAAIVESRQGSVRRAHRVVDQLKAARSQSNPKFFAGVFHGSYWGTFVIHGNLPKIDEQLQQIVNDLNRIEEELERERDRIFGSHINSLYNEVDRLDH